MNLELYTATLTGDIIEATGILYEGETEARINKLQLTMSRLCTFIDDELPGDWTFEYVSENLTACVERYLNHFLCAA